MKIEKAMDIALTILVDHDGHQIGYDKLFFLFRKRLPSADPKMFDMTMESLKDSQCVAYDKSGRGMNKVYLTASGIQLYIDGGFYQNILFRKMKIIFFVLLTLATGGSVYSLL